MRIPLPSEGVRGRDWRLTPKSVQIGGLGGAPPSMNLVVPPALH